MDVESIRDDDVIYFLAASIDGFIARPDGDVRWLEPYFIPELGFHEFMPKIRSVIMGRRSFDRFAPSGKWPYGTLPGIVASHRPLPEIDGPVSRAEGEAADILAAARSRAEGPVWLVGGADLATQFLEQGALTRIDLFTFPVLLGQGIPAFREPDMRTLDLMSSATYPKGITRNTWRPVAAP